MIRLTKNLATVCLAAGSFVSLASTTANAWTVDCKSVGHSGFSGSVVVTEDSTGSHATNGAADARATVSIDVSWVDRTAGKDPGPYHDSFHGTLNGTVRKFAAGDLTVGESTLLAVHNDADEAKAGLKILVGLKRKNATFTYKGLVFEALCE